MNMDAEKSNLFQFHSTTQFAYSFVFLCAVSQGGRDVQDLPDKCCGDVWKVLLQIKETQLCHTNLLSWTHPDLQDSSQN